MSNNRSRGDVMMGWYIQEIVSITDEIVAKQQQAQKR